MRDPKNYEVDCPHCGARLRQHDSPEKPGKPPEPGDMTHCARCSKVSVFALKLRPMTSEEWEGHVPHKPLEIGEIVAQLETMWRESPG